MYFYLTWYVVEVSTGHTPHHIVGVKGEVILAGKISGGGVLGVASIGLAELALIQ